MEWFKSRQEITQDAAKELSETRACSTYILVGVAAVHQRAGAQLAVAHGSHGLAVALDQRRRGQLDHVLGLVQVPDHTLEETVWLWDLKKK